MQDQAVVADQAGVNGKIHDLAAIRWARARHEWLDRVWASDVSDSAKVVARAISCFINKAGIAWPTEATIGAKCGKTDRAVRRAVAELRAAGFLKTKKARFRGPLEYQLAVTNADVGGQTMRTPASAESYKEPLKEDSSRTLERPSSEGSECQPAAVLAFDQGRKVQQEDKPSDKPIRTATDESAARAVIGRKAALLLGLPDGKLPDGRYSDRACLEAMQPDQLAALITKCRKGRLMESDLAAAVAGLQIRAVA